MGDRERLPDGLGHGIEYRIAHAPAPGGYPARPDGYDHIVGQRVPDTPIKEIVGPFRPLYRANFSLIGVRTGQDGAERPCGTEGDDAMRGRVMFVGGLA